MTGWTPWLARRLAAPPVEFKAMDHLHAEGELTAGQLADRLALSSGAVTALIDRLERLGWAKRSAHPSDRRSVVVHTVHGPDDEAMKLFRPFARGAAAAARRMSGAERAAAVRFLEEAAGVAREVADELKRGGG